MPTCPGCGASVHLEDGADSFTCEYCKQVFTPEEDSEGVRVLGDASTMECPVCAVGLVNASIAHHRILYCGQCHGTLIGMEEFVAFMDDLQAGSHHRSAVPHTSASDELQRHIRCPHCRRQMDTHYYAGPGNIVIDSCSPCELNWLDAGELQRVGRAPDEYSKWAAKT